MRKERLLREVEELLRVLQDARTDLAPVFEAGLGRGGKLREAARSVADSSSGSWVGWHSRMYFGDYEEPAVAVSWNTEWGGVHGFHEGWHERSLADVQAEIERRAGITLGDLAGDADRARETCEPLHQEVLTVLSPVCDLAGLDREAGLLANLETTEWIVPPGNFVEALAPGHIMSRDSGAMSQGMQAPLHLHVEAAIVSNTSTLTTCRDFLDGAIRLTRQASTKLAAIPDARPLEPGSTAPGADPTIVRQLVRRSLALFGVLALVTIAGVALVLRELVHDRLTTALVIVAAAVGLAGLYALLVNRQHAWRVLVIAGGIGGAVATLDQLLGPFFD